MLASRRRCGYIICCNSGIIREIKLVTYVYPAILIFPCTQGIFANLVGPELPDLIAGLVSLISLIAFVQFWKPKYRPEFAASLVSEHTPAIDEENINDTRSSIHENVENISKDKTETGVGLEDTGRPQNAAAENEKGVISHHEHESNSFDETAAPKALEVERPNVRETLLAWSPWVIIVVVVIM